MADNTIAQAYIQIKPSMDGVTGDLEQAMSSAGTKSSSSFGSAFASGVKQIGAVTAAAVGAAATGVSALTKTAVSSYADFEQLKGGIETLFGDDLAKDVLDNANAAFQTAGLSANEYMETVTGFSASLISSLGEYSWQAANYADLAIVDMSDNANKMGSSMESIQNAYQGFAKQNYTMLDNLKLGYGGTKEEMERLLRDAEELEGYELGSLDISNFADIVEAIHIVQENLGIAGATEAEAASTISGSIASMQSAWANLVAGFANGDADLSALINNLVTTASTAISNLMPAIQQALVGIGDFIVQLAPIIGEKLPELIDALLPSLVNAAMALVQALVQALPDIIRSLIDVLPELIEFVISAILDLLPMIIELGLDLILALADGIIDALPELIPAIVDVVLTIVDKLTEPDTLLQLIEAAIMLIMALAEGLIEALPKLLEKAPIIISNLVEAIVKAAPKLLEAAANLIVMLVKGIVTNLPRLLESATQIVFTIAEGIVKVLGELIMKGKEIVDSIKEGFSQKVEDAKNWGKDLIDNFINGIKEKWEHLKETVSNVANTVKDFLGFSEPDKGPLSNFHTFAPDMMELFASGIKDNVGLVNSAIDEVTGGIESGMTVNPKVMTTSTANYSGVVTNSSSDVVGLLAEYLPYLKDKQSVEIDLVGGATGLFKAVKAENANYMRRTGQSAFV